MRRGETDGGDCDGGPDSRARRQPSQREPSPERLLAHADGGDEYRCSNRKRIEQDPRTRACKDDEEGESGEHAERSREGDRNRCSRRMSRCEPQKRGSEKRERDERVQRAAHVAPPRTTPYTTDSSTPSASRSASTCAS